MTDVDKPRWLLKLSRVVDSVSSKVNLVGMILLAGLMLTISIDVILRYIFNRPLKGSIDIIEVMLVIVVFFGMAYTETKGGHVTVDILTSRLSHRARAVVDSIARALVAGVLVIITWQSIVYAIRWMAAGPTTSVLRIPEYPLILVVAFGSTLFLLVVLIKLIYSISEALSYNLRRSSIELAIAISLISLFCAALFWHWLPTGVNPSIVGLLGIGLLFTLLFSGIPVGFALAVVGILGASYIASPQAAFGKTGLAPYTAATTYSWVIIPLFVLMGELAFVSGMSGALYSAAHKWVARLPGGLASATVAACAGFGAISGSNIATAVTMGTVALPEMKKYKYHPELATGCVAAGGGIGTMIPPSITFVLYGLLAEQSIGRLFIAGIFPGLLIATVFISIITFRCRRKPELGPPGPSVNLMEKLRSLRGVWPILTLFALVMGGIYLGVFSPSEAGAIGAFGALVIGLSLRRLTWKGLQVSLLDTGKVTSMGFLLLIGAAMASYFLAASRLPFMMAEYVSGLDVPRLVILLTVISVYLGLGCILPAYPMIVLTVPIIWPVMEALGYDGVWFGVLIVMLCEVAVITPPVGINVYVIKAIATDVPMGTIFRGVLPFVLGFLISIALIIAFPQIALFLPTMMKG